MTVKVILNGKGRDVAVTEPQATLEDAAKLLSQRRIGALVVLGADQRVIGIISERDIVHALASRGSTALQEPVAQAMTRNVITCSDVDTVVSVMETMTQGKYRHVPVVENGRLCGIVSIGDLVKHRLHEMEQESRAMQDYIRTA